MSIDFISCQYICITFVYTMPIYSTWSKLERVDQIFPLRSTLNYLVCTLFRTDLRSIMKRAKNESTILTQRLKIKDGFDCKGDSGGPVFVEKEGSSVVIGLVSFHYPIGLWLSWPPQCYCNCEGFPDVHAKVSTAVPWIQQVMADKKLALSCARK